MAGVLCSCASGSHNRTSGTPGGHQDSSEPSIRVTADRDQPRVGVLENKKTSITRADWEFNGDKGLLIESPHYRIYTTGKDDWMKEHAARFAEAALDNYRTFIADLPAPDRPLDVYLFAERSQWQKKTKEMMGDSADLYLNLGRGGYSTRGTAVLFDIGYKDTFAILAHEGWHQYTQIKFKHLLPTWLEEGIATYMEGRIQSKDDEITFDPWSNRKRLEALGRASWQYKLIPLGELIDRTPQYFLEANNGKLLTYYAQVWALTLFLMYGEDEKYQEGFSEVLSDASDGTLVSTVMTSNKITPALRRRVSASTIGPAVILVYFNQNFKEFKEEYEKFIQKIVKDQGYKPRFRRSLRNAHRSGG